MKFKKLVSVLAFVLVLTTATSAFSGVTVNAESENDVYNYAGFLYQRDPYEPVAELVGYTYKNNSTVSIPDEIYGYKIIQIAEGVFSDMPNLTTVYIPDSTEYLYPNAFINCPKLSTVVLGEKMESISGGFYNCPKLNTITLSSENTNLTVKNGLVYSEEGKNLHFCPPGFTGTVTIASGTEKIETNAIYSCGKVTNVVFPDSLKEMAQYSIAFCDNLNEITIPKNVETLEEGALSLANGLENILVSQNNQNFSSVQGILFDKIGEKLIVFPIGRNGACTLPNNTKIIGKYAFANSEITSVSIPSRVHTIEESAFDAADSLESFTVSADNNIFSSQNGMLFDKKQTKILDCPEGKSGEITLPETVTRIAGFAFTYCDKITRVTLPSKTESIGIYAFAYCTNLKRVDFNEELWYIEAYAFAFSGIEYAKFPEELFMCDMGVFYDCLNLKTVDINPELCDIPDDMFLNCISLTSLNIPEGIETVGKRAFYNCLSLKYLYLPKSLEFVDDEAFYYINTSLTAYYGGEELDDLGYYSEEDSRHSFTQSFNFYLNAEPCREHNYNFGLYCTKCNYYTFAPTLVLDDNLYYYNYAAPESFTGIFNYMGVDFYFRDGVWDYETTTVTEHNGKLVYVTEGTTDYEFTGMVTVDGVEYFVKNGVVTENLDQPKVSLSVVSNGVKLSWKKISCATGYKIYKSTYKNGAWTEYSLYSRTTSLSYTDKNIKSGTKARYTVYAYNDTHTSKYKTGLSTTFLSQPKVKVTNAKTGVYVSWGKVSGAKEYKIYRSTYSSGKWSDYKLYKTTKTTSYTDKNVTSGKRVRYTVYACNSSKSAYKTGVITTYLTPKTPKVTKMSSGFKVSWSKKSADKGFRVYRRQYSGGKWSSLKAIKKTSSTSFTDKTAKRGVNYQYVVRSYNGDYRSAIVYSKTVKR